jgi:hypothetical protein
MLAKQVGWIPTKQLEEKVKAGYVLIAESDEATKARSDEGEENASASSSSPSVASSLPLPVPPSATINTSSGMISGSSIH